jgi:xanthine dehydrogenase YagR molybdenum-binding subunit
MEVAWIDEHDPHVNPMGSKGIGEIGICGSPAAIANAVYHATGVRVRDLPITPDKLLL